MIECQKCHTPLPDNSRFCFACGADQTGGGQDARASGQMDNLQARLQRVVQGKYELKRMLGKGGMGAVFLAQDLTLEREVAIKVLPPDFTQDPQVVKRFQQEAKTAAKLDHTNIIPIYRVESEEGLNYFVMKYISGTSLEDVLERKEPLSIDYVQRVLWEAACALGHAHSRGVVHRDVKPANIMFDHDGRVMLTDFGISKALQAASGLTGTGMIIGTPHYMAPEQAKGQPVDGRADQYSLGVVGYRMLTGALPFSGDSVHTILYKHIFEDAPRVSGAVQNVPSHLANAIQRALSKDPAQRFPTMEEFATSVWPEQPVTAGKATPRAGQTMRPGGGPTTPAPKGPVTADTPTEFVNSAAAATTPMPVAHKPKPAAPPPAAPRAPEKKAKPSKAPLFIGVGVVAIGVVAVLVLKGGGKAPAGAPTPVQTPIVQSTTQSPSPATATPIESTPKPPPAPVATKPAPATKPTTHKGRPAQQPAAAAPAPARAAAQGTITIDAQPYGEVYVDGKDMGQTPLINWTVSAGAHKIRIERPGFKTINETIQVDAENPVRKRYSLTPE